MSVQKTQDIVRGSRSDPTFSRVDGSSITFSFHHIPISDQNVADNVMLQPLHGLGIKTHHRINW